MWVKNMMMMASMTTSTDNNIYFDNDNTAWVEQSNADNEQVN